MRLRNSVAPAYAQPTGTAAQVTPARDVLEALGLAAEQTQRSRSRAAATVSQPVGDAANTGAVISLGHARAAEDVDSPASLRRQAATPFARQIRDIVATFGAPSSEGRGRTVVIAGNDRPGATSLVAASLAVLSAASGLRIMLVDANLARPRLHSLFGIANEAGLSTLLADATVHRQLLQSCSIPNLAIMAAGPNAGNHASLLARAPVLHRLAPMTAAFDIVFVDCATLPPRLVASCATGATDVIIGATRHRSSLRELANMVDELRLGGVEDPSALLFD